MSFIVRKYLESVESRLRVSKTFSNSPMPQNPLWLRMVTPIGGLLIVALMIILPSFCGSG